MGRHHEWRKLAKKLRRKRIRQEQAKKRDELEKKENEKLQNSPSYQKYIEEQNQLEIFQREEEERLAKERHEEWLKREEQAQKEWKELQERLAKIASERAKEEERILEEWKKEQESIKIQKEKMKQLKAENERKQQLVKEKIEEFIAHGGELPEELNGTIESNPTRELCPFFQKTGACRYGELCSRNHTRLAASRVLLFPSFYSHFSLNHTVENEYGSDFSLEYDDRETYFHFREFFNDILPEFNKYGDVRQLKVCCNKEAHLRGNVYVEYANIREALKAYQVFQGRWYGGKQLTVEFCNIISWKSAICGLNFRKRCPKGSTCNFLHVFVNPRKMFSQADRDLHRTPPTRQNNFNDSESEAYSSRRWRWSESPENDVTEKENYDWKTVQNGVRRAKHKYREEDSRHKRKSRSSSRSRSSSKSSRSSRSSSHSRKKHKRRERD